MEKTEASQRLRSSAFSLVSLCITLSPEHKPKTAFLFVLSPNVATQAFFFLLFQLVLSFCLPDGLLPLLYPSLAMVPSFHLLCVLYKRKEITLV